MGVGGIDPEPEKVLLARKRQAISFTTDDEPLCMDQEKAAARGDQCFPPRFFFVPCLTAGFPWAAFLGLCCAAAT